MTVVEGFKTFFGATSVVFVLLFIVVVFEPMSRV
jgi:hypothetical protein